MGTIMQSKENQVWRLFFNNPTKEWHFEEIVREAKCTRGKVYQWLMCLVKNGLITRFKPERKMPYYVSNYNSSKYKTRKKLFAFEELYMSGFLEHLNALPKAKSVIIFGSFVRSDWYSESDIDLFIYGDSDGLKISNYELKLHRDIQVFICKTEEDLKRFGASLIKNIIRGSLIKGGLDFVRVELNA